MPILTEKIQIALMVFATRQVPKLTHCIFFSVHLEIQACIYIYSTFVMEETKAIDPC